MRRAINILSLTGIAVALAWILYSYLPKASAKAAFDDFPTDHSRLIDFQVKQDVLDAMTNREKVDQMRDWLLTTVIADSGLSPQEMNQTLYDLPPIRYGYMQSIANFEYEETRSRFI